MHEALERRSKKKEIKRRQNYADILVPEFLTEIQSHYFGGKNSLLIKSVELKHYRNNADSTVLTKNKVDTLIEFSVPIYMMIVGKMYQRTHHTLQILLKFWSITIE